MAWRLADNELEHVDRYGRGLTYHKGIYLTGLKKIMANLSQCIRCHNQHSGHVLHVHMLQDLPFETKSFFVTSVDKMAKSDYLIRLVSASFLIGVTTRVPLEGFLIEFDI
jgi:hypothetical protein